MGSKSWGLLHIVQHRDHRGTAAAHLTVQCLLSAMELRQDSLRIDLMLIVQSQDKQMAEDKQNATRETAGTKQVWCAWGCVWKNTNMTFKCDSTFVQALTL